MVRQSHDSLIFMMGSPYTKKDGLSIEMNFRQTMPFQS